MAADFGDDVECGLWSDASAAIAISQRSDLGKLRHIQTQFLWLQQRVSAKELKLTKAVGTANPADMLTKNLAKADLEKHLRFSGLILREGRADGSLHVNAFSGVTCYSMGGRTAAALRLAMGPRVVMETSDLAKPISSVGGCYSSTNKLRGNMRAAPSPWCTLLCLNGASS